MRREGDRPGDDPNGGHGVPHVGAVVIDDGETLTADLVVDAMGRHTSIDRMLEAMGAPRPQEQNEDLGYVYYARQFRNHELGRAGHERPRAV